jgi:signal transduction histidine kinase
MPHEQCPMAEVIAGTLAEACDAEVLIERPDGSRITVIVNIRPLKNERGDIMGAINCFYDITARKEMEDSLRDSDRRKSEFLAMLAHELRNPLAPIRHCLVRRVNRHPAEADKIHFGATHLPRLDLANGRQGPKARLSEICLQNAYCTGFMNW